NQRDIISHYDDGTLKFKLMSDGTIYTTSGWKYRYATINNKISIIFLINNCYRILFHVVSN
ncbi:hypothetical protein KKA77_01830, partial [Patescibacteria group bacterium]|nr:hypothetical protein [Patescibacteria group bacterium]MBU1783304.1 hypothetical protein [Patescibacteria group bacterium]